MSTLAQIRDRVELMLLDIANAIYTADLIDESLKQALDLYNQVNPGMAEAVITLPGDGREIALDSLSGLLRVVDVWWPYDSTATQETWPPNRVQGYRLWWDVGQPVLILEIKEGDQPQADDEMRVWYTSKHTIEGLSSAASTTVPAEHESLLVIGAAGMAALSRTEDLVETAGTDLYAVGILGTWGKTKVRDFNTVLKELRAASARGGQAWGVGWQLDKWDEGRES